MEARAVFEAWRVDTLGDCYSCCCYDFSGYYCARAAFEREGAFFLTVGSVCCATSDRTFFL